MPFAPIEDVLADLRAGRMIVLTDDEDRENEGDLVLAAEFVTPEAITFMLSKALGYLCLSLTEADCDRLDLFPQSGVNTTPRGTAFTVSIDLHPKHGGTTGVSAKERAQCIRMAIDPAFGPGDFARPGHINPLRSRDGGVLVRTGQTEGSLDLCRLAGLKPAACIIEIMKPDGEMARLPDLETFSREHGLNMCSVAQIIEHRLARESLVRRLEPAEGRPLRTRFGTFAAHLYESLVDPLPHLVLTLGDVGSRHDERPTLVRMHRRHLLGDVFEDLDSAQGGTSGETLRAAMAMIQREGRGAIVYLRTQSGGTDTGVADLEARLQTPQRPPVEHVHESRAGANRVRLPSPSPGIQRDIGIGGQILRDLGVSQLRLISNSARSLPGLEAYGLRVVERVPPIRVM